MVNTGKPSGACKLCRARRVKCDETKPTCLRCQKAKRTCPGYRNPLEANIRDETQATIRRYMRSRDADSTPSPARNSRRKISVSSSDSSPKGTPWALSTMPFSNTFFIEPLDDGEDYSDEDFSFDYSERQSPVSRRSFSKEGITMPWLSSLQVSREDQASCFFMSEFVLMPTCVSSRGYYRFLPALLRKSGASSTIASAYKAVTLAALATRRDMNMRQTLYKAQEQYLQAVTDVNKAIQIPDAFKQDETLAAVLLLAMYELLTSSNGRIKEYINHLKGAAILIKLRGSEGIMSREGRDLFAATRNSVLALHCMPCPPSIHDFDHLLQQDNPDPFASPIADMDLSMSQVRQEIDRVFSRGAVRNASTIEAVLKLLRKAQTLEKKFAKLNNTPSPQWAVELEPPSAVPADSPCANAVLAAAGAYKFPTLPSAVLHMATWTCHLMLVSSILRCTAWLATPDDYRLSREYQALGATATRRVMDLAATIPFFCRWDGRGAAFACGKTVVSTDAAQAPTSTRAAPAMMVLWPLMAACSSDFATDAQRAFLHGRLRYLADVGGLWLANTILQQSQVKRSPSDDIERDRAKWDEGF